MDGEIKRQTQRGGNGGRPWVARDRDKSGLQDSDEVGLLEVNFLSNGIILTIIPMHLEHFKIRLELEILKLKKVQKCHACSKLTFWFLGVCLPLNSCIKYKKRFLDFEALILERLKLFYFNELIIVV